MKKMLFNREQEILYPTAAQFIDRFGAYKLDPYSNVRTADFSCKSGTTETRLQEANKKTIKNNKDKTILKKSIFEDGYDSSKQTITVMRLSDYLRGRWNRENIRRIYMDDSKFIYTVDAIISILERTDLSEEETNLRLEALEGYYVVVGGNTRISLIFDCYESDPERFKTDGSMETIIPVNLINLNSLGLIANCCLTKNDSFSAKDNYDLSILNQILWDLTVYADNKLSAARNIPVPVLMLSKGNIGKLIVDSSNISFGDTEVLSAFKTIKSFSEVLKAVGIGQKEMAEALIYRNIYNYFKGYDDDDLAGNWEEELSFVVKVATSAMVNSEAMFDYQSKFCHRIGLSADTFEVDSEPRMINFINWCCKMHSKKKAAGSYLGRPLKIYLQQHLDKDVRKISNSEYSAAKAFAEKEFEGFIVKGNSDLMLEKLYTWLDNAKNNITRTIEISDEEIEAVIKAFEAKE